MSVQSKDTGVFNTGEIWDPRHDPIIARFPVKTGTALKRGQAVKIEADNETIDAAAAADAKFLGIALDDATGDGNVHINVLLHGTLKMDKATVGSAALTAADIQKLREAGIYALN